MQADDEDFFDLILIPFLAQVFCCVAILGGLCGIKGVVMGDERLVFVGFRTIAYAALGWFAWETVDRLIDKWRDRAIRKVYERAEASESVN